MICYDKFVGVVGQDLCSPFSHTKKFVYVLNDSNVTVNRQIEVEPLTYEQNYIVTKGLKVGDRVVVEGVGASVKNKMKITPITKEQSEAKLNAITK